MQHLLFFVKTMVHLRGAGMRRMQFIMQSFWSRLPRWLLTVNRLIQRICLHPRNYRISITIGNTVRMRTMGRRKSDHLLNLLFIKQEFHILIATDRQMTGITKYKALRRIELFGYSIGPDHIKAQYFFAVFFA